jgi:uncharacterized protein YbbK (DUF523 family)
LLGEEVRFNGGHKRFRFLTDELDPYVDWVPYCPEVEIGLVPGVRAAGESRRRESCTAWVRGVCKSLVSGNVPGTVRA